MTPPVNKRVEHSCNDVITVTTDYR